MYDLNNAYPMSPYLPTADDNAPMIPNHPLCEHPALLAVPPITKDMSEADRNAALDRLDEFYEASGMATVRGELLPNEGNSGFFTAGTANNQLGRLFSPRPWYCLYGLKVDLIDKDNGNDWITQNEGWMTTYGTPKDASDEDQNGTYVYCSIE